MPYRRLSWLAVFLLAACSDGPGDPSPAPDASGTLVIVPGALLLAETGATHQLRAVVIGASGDSTPVNATFESSAPDVVSVSAAGLATGGTLGSAQIVARSASRTSAPILALRATPASGALLVSDEQIAGPIVPADPTAAYQPGWRYGVRLRGVTPAAGQVVLASGGTALGGRVVSVGATADGADVVLELISLREMFTALSIDQHLDLRGAALAPARLGSDFEMNRLRGGGVRLSAREGGAHYEPSQLRPSSGRSRIEQEFELGPFSCKAELPPLVSFPLTVDVYSFELDPTLGLDLVIQDMELRRLVVNGGIAPRLQANPRLTAAVEAKAECKVTLAHLILPIGGPIAMIVGGQVPLGVGFELGAKANVGEFGYDAFLQSAISTEFGVDCPAACSVVADVSGTSTGSYFRLLHPTSVWSTRVELGLSAFGWAELEIGNPVLSALRFKAVEMKGGLEQKFELASTETQVADPAYASSYALKPVFEAKAASNLTPIANLLSVNIATLSFAPELPALARSPSGSFTISPASVAPGDGTQLGERATFTVALNDVNYLGAYAVEGVQLRWDKSNGGVVTLETGRPGCSDLAAAQDQVTFTCQTDFLTSHAGLQTFRAFVKTRIFGVPIPVPLEIAPDARATVTVGPGTGPGAGIVLLVDRTSPAGVVTARTFFTVGGFVCGKLDTVLTGSLQGSLAARCSNTAVSTAGNAMSATSDATGSYTLTIASGRLATLRADGSASGTATGEAGVGPPTDGALITASKSFGISFDVVGSAVNVVLRGTVSSNIPDPSSNATGTAIVSITGPETSEVFQAGRRLDADPVLPTLTIDRTLRLSPGRYNLNVQADARSTSDFNHASASAGTGYSLTMSVAP